MTHYFRAFLIGLILLALVIFMCHYADLAFPDADASVNYPVEVTFPEKYTWDDGTVLTSDQYQGTKVMYGTCDENTEIGELLGEVMAPSTTNKTGTFNVPSKMVLCFVAVVVDLDGQPLGKSYPAKFSTYGKIPTKPVNVFTQ